MNICFVRHGPVPERYKGRIYGDEADCELEDQQDIIKKLSAMLPAPGEALWYSSGVGRAHKTGAAVLRIMNANLNPDSIITKHAGFREQAFGKLLGKPLEEIEDHAKMVDGKLYAPEPPDGESIKQFIQRISANIAQVKEDAARRNCQHAVVFCHGGTIRAAHLVISKASLETFIQLDTPYLSAHAYSL